jgi:hypothetical protein
MVTKEEWKIEKTHLIAKGIESSREFIRSIGVPDVSARAMYEGLVRTILSRAPTLVDAMDAIDEVRGAMDENFPGEGLERQSLPDQAPQGDPAHYGIYCPGHGWWDDSSKRIFSTVSKIVANHQFKILDALRRIPDGSTVRMFWDD